VLDLGGEEAAEAPELTRALGTLRRLAAPAACR
jgi:hypothetical protein